MSKVKKIKVKQTDGNFSEPVDIGADAKNILMEDGQDLETVMSGVKNDITNLQSSAVTEEEDPTVPNYVKQISENDIAKWNNIYWKTVE